MSGLLWRKQVLPQAMFVRNRPDLTFEHPDFPAMTAAFAAKVPGSVGLFGSAETLNPVSVRGIVLALEAPGDGLDAIIEADMDADRLFAENPGTPVGVMLCRDYRDTSGKMHPLVLWSVYLTERPLFTGLRPWAPARREGASYVSGPLS